MSDPFEALAVPATPEPPRPSFARRLRERLQAELAAPPPDPGVPAVRLPERRPPVSTTTSASTAGTATAVTPYLTARNASAALDWYVEAFGAVEQFRVVGDDGRLGHAELTVGDAHLMLSDEYPEMGVVSPSTLGGTATALHLTVTDVDALFARAVEAGATALREPEDQPHGARHGTLLDPYGHRWMLSQPLEELDLGAYRERSRGSGYEVVGAPPEQVAAADRPGTGGGIWAGVFYADAHAGIRFLVDVFGFEEQLVVDSPDGRAVVHSELRWPEGGIVQAGTHDPANPFSLAPGTQQLYVITADPQAVWRRAEAAGLEVLRPPYEPDHDPGGLSFSVRDPEGNIWSFGTYGLERR